MNQQEISQAIDKAVKESNHPLPERFYCPLCHTSRLKKQKDLHKHACEGWQADNPECCNMCHEAIIENGWWISYRNGERMGPIQEATWEEKIQWTKYRMPNQVGCNELIVEDGWNVYFCNGKRIAQVYKDTPEGYAEFLAEEQANEDRLKAKRAATAGAG